MGLTGLVDRENQLFCEGTLELIFTFEAASYFEAMQKYYDFMAWGTYRPEPDWEDQFYTPEQQQAQAAALAGNKK